MIKRPYAVGQKKIRELILKFPNGQLGLSEASGLGQGVISRLANKPIRKIHLQTFMALWNVGFTHGIRFKPEDFLGEKQ